MTENQTPGVYAEDSAKAITGASTSLTAFVGATPRGPVNEPLSISSFGAYTALFDKPASHSAMAHAVAGFFRNGGTTAIIVRVAPPAEGPITAETIIGSQAEQTGMFALDKIVRFNLLCLPPANPGSDTPAAVWQAAAEYCDTRGAMLLVDAPAAWGASADPAQAARDGLAAFDIFGDAARNAVLYFPQFVGLDADTGQPNGEIYPPSGIVAGIMASVDAAEGVWQAPAGVTFPVRTTGRPQCAVADADQVGLNPIGINCIRTFPSYGTVLWGARTLISRSDANDEFAYIGPRRLTLYIEQSIVAGTQWAVFEPNTPALWSELRQTISSFLAGVWLAGGLFGSSARDAYNVVCDSTTNTPESVEAGIVTVLVQFAPVHPAEFIVLEIQLVAGQAA